MNEAAIWVLTVWLFALALGVPIYLTLALAGAVLAFELNVPALVVPQRIAMAANSFPLVAAPFFIFMAGVMNFSGVTTRIFQFAGVLVGWLPGGLAHANIVASVIFAGMSGSAVADAGGLGTLEIKAMRDAGYQVPFAAAVTAASSTIGPILPPSLPMVIYGVIAETSIGGLFLGAVVPGLLMALALMVRVYLVAEKEQIPRHPFPGFIEMWRSFKEAFWALLTPVILLWGILSGVFTPTEAAVVAAAYALVVGGLVYRDFTLEELPRVITDTVHTTGVVMALVMTAVLMAWTLSAARVPQTIGFYLASLAESPLTFLLITNLLLLLVGLFMEAIAAMLILVPILVPAAMTVGIDPLQFGVIFVLNLMIGTITPPVGIVLFVTAKIAEISFEEVAKATLPFLLPLIIVLLLITFFPPLTTWLPRLFGL